MLLSLGPPLVYLWASSRQLLEPRQADLASHSDIQVERGGSIKLAGRPALVAARMKKC